MLSTFLQMRASLSGDAGPCRGAAVPRHLCNVDRRSPPPPSRERFASHLRVFSSRLLPPQGVPVSFPSDTFSTFVPCYRVSGPTRDRLFRFIPRDPQLSSTGIRQPPLSFLGMRRFSDLLPAFLLGPGHICAQDVQRKELSRARREVPSCAAPTVRRGARNNRIPQ